MKISTRLKFTALVPAIMAVIIGFAIIFSYTMVRDAQDKDRSAQRIITGMNGLSSLVGEYVLHHEERPLQQFLEEHDSITRLIAVTEFDGTQQKQVLNDIRRDIDLMKGSFLKLVANHERYRLAKGDVLTKEVENRLAGRLLVWSRDVASQASYLEKLVDEELTTTQKKNQCIHFWPSLPPLTLFFGTPLERNYEKNHQIPYDAS